MLLFIADLHLDASRPQTAQAFFDFIDQYAKQADTLYILGDLFELWVGDDDDDPFILSVQAQLKKLSLVTPIFFMRGNRDFLIGDKFAANSGVTLLDDPTPITVDGHTLLLMHGDTLCTRDTAYQAFRAESRSQAWYDNVMSMSLQQRRQLGQQLRQQSKTMSSRKADDIMDVSDDAVKAAITKYAAQKLIHGHTHRPKRHSLTMADGIKAERIVLGDWDQLAWCLVYDGDWALKHWNISDS